MLIRHINAVYSHEIQVCHEKLIHGTLEQMCSDTGTGTGGRGKKIFWSPVVRRGDKKENMMKGSKEKEDGRIAEGYVYISSGPRTLEILVAHPGNQGS